MRPAHKQLHQDVVTTGRESQYDKTDGFMGSVRQSAGRAKGLTCVSRAVRNTAKADSQRTGFHIPSVRNPVAESIVCGRLGLDLDGSIRATQRDLEKP